MIEAFGLIMLGGALAKLGLMPLQEALIRRQDRRDHARALELAAAIRKQMGLSAQEQEEALARS